MRLFVFSFVAILLFGELVVADDVAIPDVGGKPDSSEEKVGPAFVIKKQVNVESLLGSYRMVIDLGKLKPGVTGRVDLELVNNNDVSFPVKELEIGCRCASAHFVGDEITRHSSAKLEMTLTTPATSRSVTNSTSIKLVSRTNESLDIDLVFSYQLVGLMTFLETVVNLEVDPERDRQAVMVPFLLSDPVRAQDVLLTFSPGVVGIKADIVVENDKTYVKIEFEPIQISPEGLFLDLLASDNSRAFSSKLTIFLRQRKNVDISPLTLRFRRNGENLEASSIVRYRPRSVDSTEPELAEHTVYFEAAIDKQKLNIRSQRLGKGIYRVYLVGSEAKLHEALTDENISKPLKVQWQIVTPEKTYSIKSLVDVSLDSSVTK